MLFIMLTPEIEGVAPVRSFTPKWEFFDIVGVLRVCVGLCRCICFFACVSVWASPFSSEAIVQVQNVDRPLGDPSKTVKVWPPESVSTSQADSKTARFHHCSSFPMLFRGYPTSYLLVALPAWVRESQFILLCKSFPV